MNYVKLSKLFYILNTQDFEDEYLKRTESYGCYRTSLRIRGFRKGRLDHEYFELFYVNTPDLMKLNNTVLLNSGRILALINKLPNYAVELYFHRLIINEAQSNNEIEGVRSTKRELRQVLNRLREPEAKFKRFKGLMKTYLHILDINHFRKPEDFRQLYDELVADEIDKNKSPDGRLFRKKGVEVTDGAKVTHIGVENEAKVETGLIELIRFLENEDHPELFRYLIAHYYYEYIHPFYDGNGRTGRLLVGSYLARYLERYSAVTFSYAVNKNKKKYYEALEEVSSPFNKGELTFYLKDMLEILISGQNEIIEDLELNEAKLDRINQFLNNEEWKQRKEERTLLHYLIVLTVFTKRAETQVTDMIKVLGLSRYKLNQTLVKLEKENYVMLQKSRPKSYILNPDFMEDTLKL
jgi:Fic family protein